MRSAFALFQFHDRSEISFANGIENGNQPVVFGTFDFRQLCNFESLIAFSVVESKRSIFLSKFRNVFDILFRRRRIYGRQLFGIAYEYHLNSTERIFVSSFVLKNEVHLVYVVWTDHRYFIDDDCIHFAPINFLPTWIFRFGIITVHFECGMKSGSSRIDCGYSSRCRNDDVFAFLSSKFDKLLESPSFSSSGFAGKEYVSS